MNDGGFWIQPSTLNWIEFLMFICGFAAAILTKIIINLIQDYRREKRIDKFIKLQKEINND